MNEGDSAGGGHQGSSPAPPAVPIRRPNLTITTSNVAAAAASAVVAVTATNSNNSNITRTIPSIITIVTTNSPNISSSATTILTTTTASAIRNFQQIFSHQQQHQQQQQQITTAEQIVRPTGLQFLHMPQNPSTNLVTTAVGATLALPQTTSTTQLPQQQQSLIPETVVGTTVSRTHVVTTTHITASDSPPPVKRAKYEAPISTTSSSIVSSVPINVVGSLLPATGTKPDVSSIIKTTSLSTSNTTSTTKTTTQQDFNSLKKRVLEYKYLRLRSLKEKHNENVAELFYLQSGGNMMDYPAWRKKSPTPQFVSFSNSYRLNQLIIDEKANEVAAASAVVPALGAHQQQPTAENIATIIGVSSGSVQQQPLVQQSESASTVASTTGSNKSTAIYTTSASDTVVWNLGSTASLATIKSNAQLATISSPSATISGTEQNDGSLLPQGAEIKIPAVGATPVAVSTKLPAAVVQLSQQGGTPLVPVGSSAPLRKNGHSNTLPASGSTNNVTIVTTTTTPPPPPPLYTPAHPSGLLRPASANGGSMTSSTLGGNSAQEFSFKAKQEVYVMQRVSELQREGLWTEKRLPKLQEPSRPKAHWDYLLEEMVWLATDFAQERKWKKNAAKKCSRMVQKYFQDKANAAQKAEKAQEAHQRRIAAFIAKEIKYFWSNVEKLVEYKHHTKLEEKRKKALDQHLSFIVDQTEKFSQQLAEGMNKGIGTDATLAASTATSLNASRISSPKPEDNGMSDDDFRPDTGSEDDEETIAKADEEETNVKEEVDVLEKESRMELEDLLDDSLIGYLKNREKLMEQEKKGKKFGAGDEDGGVEGEENANAASTSTKEDEDDDEFEANEASEDDENTISKQEEEEMDVDHQKELNELEADNDLTVEQLLEKYKSDKVEDTKKRKSTAAENIDSDDDEIHENSDDMSETSTDVNDGSSAENSEDEGSEEESDSEADDQDKEEEGGLKSLLEDDSFTGNNKDDMIKDAAALAESIQPKGNTLSSTDVVTPVPFLLKHSLREYQHIGLDWLVTMNERKLNGILADEMGLGKTIQTIALLAHLACVKGNWGPHLIVVPSSVMLNWEMEFKKWCPGFKILTYYGTQKERKLKRVGWTKPNAFHVCITSYKLVVQDQQSFRRKKWKYLILDEAQNIKNFKSQRWQLLLNFSTERRLLLTGTPLQNDLMELWSLMHFLMPYVFSSHREFKEWFSNPMTGMIEGNMEYNESLISRLHKVIRPFLLRRLKKEVEKQMPKKYEHVIMCRLSNRQRYLYDDFMSRAKTKETLQTGNLLSVINVLMQLRKVCNHPNMFEVRPTISPFQMEGISFETPRHVCDLLEYDPFTQIDLKALNLLLIRLELTLTAYASYRSQKIGAPRQLIEEIDSVPEPPPRCPTGKFKFHIRVRDADLQQNISRFSAKSVRVGASPAMKTEGNQLLPVHNNLEIGSGQSRLSKRMVYINPINMTVRPRLIEDAGSLATTSSTSSSPAHISRSSPIVATAVTPTRVTKMVQGSGKPYLVFTSTSSGSGVHVLTDANSSSRLVQQRKPIIAVGSSRVTTASATKLSEKPKLLATIAKEIKSSTAAKVMKMEVDNEIVTSNNSFEVGDDAGSELDPVYNMNEILKQRKEARVARLKLMADVNRRRIEAVPIYGSDCREAIWKCGSIANQKLQYSTWQTRGYTNCRTAMELRDGWTLSKLIKSYEDRCTELRQMFTNFMIYVPSTCAPRIRFYTQHLTSLRLQNERNVEATIANKMSSQLALLHPIISAMTTQFPDPRLIQYDCGKLQTLDRLLRQLKSEQHRVLIFTQMTKMLDVLEAFLNHHGHIYLRLDGSTRVEQRQVLMERFNGDKRIFCFILSTRSGGVGINLTGADTVIFYDSDWNPTMDAQAQDRCHRIGQTRDVHIYRLVSEKTIEVNILKKANQKRMLSDMAIEGGNFTTTYFKSSTIKDLFNVEQNEQEQSNDVSTNFNNALEKPSTSQQTTTTILSGETSGIGVEVESEKQSLRVFETALAAAEDEQDVQATKTAKAEVAADLAEFDETIPIDETTTDGVAPAVEMSKADLEMQNLVKQLSPIERYAMRFVEETGAAWTAEQLRAAEEEIEAQKREWEANRLAAMQKEEELLKQDADADDMLTYSRRDAINQVNKSQCRRNPKITNKKVLNRRRQLGLTNNTKSREQQKLQQQRHQQQHQKQGTRNIRSLGGSISRSRSRQSNQNSSEAVNTRNSGSSVGRRNSISNKDREQRALGIRRNLSRSNNGIVGKSGRNRQRRMPKANESASNPVRKTTRASLAAAAGTDISIEQQAEPEPEQDPTQSESECSNGETVETDRTRKDSKDGQMNKHHQNEQQQSKTGVKNQKLLKFAAKRRAFRQRTISNNSLTAQVPRKVRKLSVNVNRFNTNVANSVSKLRSCNATARGKTKINENNKNANIETEDENDTDDESKQDEEIAMQPRRKGRVIRSIDARNKHRKVVKNSRRRTMTTRSTNENESDQKEEHNSSDNVESQNEIDSTVENEESRTVRNLKIKNKHGNIENNTDEDAADTDNSVAHSSYATASDGENTSDADEHEHDDDVEQIENEDLTGINHNSIDDTWNAHAQLNDMTNATNSTYYNVSEETDSDENEATAQLSTVSSTRRSRTPNSTTKTLRNATESPLHKSNTANYLNCVDVNSPRTRSRGSVKINLWTLDVSPVLPTTLRKSKTPSGTTTTSSQRNRTTSTINTDKESTKYNDSTESIDEMTPIKTDTVASALSNRRGSTALSTTPLRNTVSKLQTPRRGLKRLASTSKSHEDNKQSVVTLHRWLLKTPRSNSTSLTNGGEDSDSSTTGNDNSSITNTNGLINTSKTS